MMIDRSRAPQRKYNQSQSTYLTLQKSRPRGEELQPYHEFKIMLHVIPNTLFF